MFILFLIFIKINVFSYFNLKNKKIISKHKPAYFFFRIGKAFKYKYIK